MVRGGAQSAASRVTFLKTMTNTIKRTATAQVFDVAKAQADLAALPPPPMEEGDKLIELALDQYEKAILPLLEAGETVLARFDGKIYEDMCEPCCVNERTWYPGCLLIALCGVIDAHSDPIDYEEAQGLMDSDEKYTALRVVSRFSEEKI